uniref:Uncharacterized protein n=1 Tax=Monopterus albus TaxID=43700 RepID=A0A3Q3IWF8_MONAL
MNSGAQCRAQCDRSLFPCLGLHFVPASWLLTHTSQTSVVCQRLRLQASRYRPLHVSPAASRCSSNTEPQRNPQTDHNRAEAELRRPEYIPRRKAKNPMMKIGYAWMIGLPTGIIGFLLAKRQVDKNRLKQLKVRQRMKKANEGEYEGSRYSHPRENVNPDR